MWGNHISLETFKNAVLVFEIITAFLAIVFYKKYNSSFLKYFLPLILYSIANEFFAKWYSQNITQNNVFFYNIFRLVDFSFYFLLYIHILEKKKNKNTIILFYLIYLLSIIISCFFTDFFTELLSAPYLIGAVFIAISIVLFFSETLNTERVVNINRSFVFWLSIAAFVSFVTSIPFKMITKYYQESPKIPYIYIANYAVVLIYYLIISFGLVWSKKE